MLIFLRVSTNQYADPWAFPRLGCQMENKHIETRLPMFFSRISMEWCKRSQQALRICIYIYIYDYIYMYTYVWCIHSVMWIIWLWIINTYSSSRFEHPGWELGNSHIAKMTCSCLVQKQRDRMKPVINATGVKRCWCCCCCCCCWCCLFLFFFFVLLLLWCFLNSIVLLILFCF